MPKLVDQGVTKLVWVPGDEGIADVSAPTTTELAAGVDLTCLMVTTYEVRPDASDTTDERAVCDTANVVAPTIQNYTGNLILFRMYEDGEPDDDDPANIFSYTHVGYFVRRTGKPFSEAFTSDDEVEVYKFMSDTPQPSGGTGEGFLKLTVPLLQQGQFDPKAVVNSGS